VAYTRSSQSAALHAKVGANAFNPPADANHRQLLSALVSEGVLTPGGAYAAGKGQASILKSLNVPSITQETLDRVAQTMGL
jgi:isopentenyl diphosphate isomerase/L-lactate dehydrogenase-like FMN-dependent dehydrogenase